MRLCVCLYIEKVFDVSGWRKVAGEKDKFRNPDSYRLKARFPVGHTKCHRRFLKRNLPYIYTRKAAYPHLSLYAKEECCQCTMETVLCGDFIFSYNISMRHVVPG